MYIKNRGITNLTRESLPPTLTSLLSYGLSFIPTPYLLSRDDIFQQALSNFFRLLKIRFFFDVHNNQSPEPVATNAIYHNLRLKSTFSPHVTYKPLLDYISKTTEDFNSIFLRTRYRYNLSRSELTAMRAFLRYPTVLLRPNDKNTGVSLIYRTDYVNAVEQQLHDPLTYREQPLDNPATQRVISCITSMTSRSYSMFPAKVKQFISQHFGNSSTIRPCPFHCLPKTHKLDMTQSLEQILRKLTYRPITAAVSYFTTPLSIWLDKLLQPLVQQLDTTVKDTKTFINTIETFVVPPTFRDSCTLITADITSLYTRIPTDDGLQRMRHFLLRPKTSQYLLSLFNTMKLESIIDIMITAFDIVLRNNYVEFNGRTYLQINGTAMGQACAVVYAVIFVYEVEQDFIHTALRNKLVIFYGRYIDDIFALALNKSAGQRFINRLNQLHPALEFTANVSTTEAEFLDTVVFKGTRFRTTGTFDLRVHQKITNRYLYIPSNSFHTISTQRGWIRGELIRYIRGHSSRDDYIALKRTFFERLRARGHHPRFLCDITNTVSYSDRPALLRPQEINPQSPDSSLNLIPYHHPSITNTQVKSALLRHWYLISQDDVLRDLFPTKPQVTYRRTRSMSEWLTRSRYTGVPSSDDSHSINGGLSSLQTREEANPNL